MTDEEQLGAENLITASFVNLYSLSEYHSFLEPFQKM